jgi:hypothetical protein
MFDSKAAGSIPEQEKVTLGRGRETHSQNSPGRATRTVSEWISGNEKTAKYWREQAGRALKTASRHSDAGGNSVRIEDTAAQILADQMKKELGGDLPQKKGENLHNDLLGDALNDINWTEVAEDLLRHEPFPDSSPFP